MIRKIFLILTIAMSLFVLSCNGGCNYITSSGGDNEDITGSSEGSNEGVTGNGEGNEDIAGGEDKTVLPTPDYDAQFLALFKNNNRVMYNESLGDGLFTSEKKAIIHNGGRSLYLCEEDKLYEFESAKSNTIAYYKASSNFLDKPYYIYTAFEIGDNELLKYQNTTSSFEEISRGFKLTNFKIGTDGELDITKPKDGIIDFSPMFPGKKDINFDTPPTLLGIIH